MKVYAKIFEKNGSKSENVNINFNSIEFKGKSFFFEKTFQIEMALFWTIYTIQKKKRQKRN